MDEKVHIKGVPMNLLYIVKETFIYFHIYSPVSLEQVTRQLSFEGTCPSLQLESLDCPYNVEVKKDFEKHV